jgi:hypothetical protein
VTAAPIDIVAVVAQLCNLLCNGDIDVYERLVKGRGLSAEQAFAALRDAGIDRCDVPPQEAWYGDEVESERRPDGTWSVSIPVWSDGVKRDVRLRFTVEDVFGDDEFWEPWLTAVET